MNEYTCLQFIRASFLLCKLLEMDFRRDGIDLGDDIFFNFLIVARSYAEHYVQ